MSILTSELIVGYCAAGSGYMIVDSTTVRPHTTINILSPCYAQRKAATLFYGQRIDVTICSDYVSFVSAARRHD